MSGIKASWVVLTYGRAETVRKSMIHNVNNAGRQWHEIIHCDNGSDDGVREVMAIFQPTVKIYHRENLGVSRGFNVLHALTTGTHIVLIGCDRSMPHFWLNTFAECFEKIPNTGVVSMYSQPIDKLPERVRGKPQTINGIDIIPSMPFGARMIRKDVFLKAGYFLENLGLYGFEDILHSERTMRVCDEMGLLYYSLPNQIPLHNGDEGVNDWSGKDSKWYHEFKIKEVRDPAKQVVMAKYRKDGYPYFNPFA